MDEKTIILEALTVIVVMNIAAFALMGHDKKCARQGKWRVPDKTLSLVIAYFGGPGDVPGMKAFHHKTRHGYFKAFFPGLPIVQAVMRVSGAYLRMR